MTSLVEQNSNSEKISDINYNIIDCNGKQSLKYINEYYAVINPYLFISNNGDTNIKELYTLTYSLRSYNKDYDLFSTKIKNKSEKLYWRIDQNTYNQIKDIKNVRGFYPLVFYKVDKSNSSDINAMLIETKINDGKTYKGKTSLEMKMWDKFKNFDFPRQVFKNDIYGNLDEIENVGNIGDVNLKLTIDRSIENTIKNVISKNDYKQFKQVGVILMESSSGAVKAMVQKDDSEANINLGVGTNSGFFPGSIFKTIVEEAALETNSINLEDKFDSKGIYHQSNFYGMINAGEAYVVSSNNVFMQIGRKVGYNIIRQYAENQGLLNKVFGFENESFGKFEVNKQEPIENQIGNISIGQKIRISPIEAISIVNTVINNGIYVKPYIIDSFVNKNKILEQFNTESKSVISQNVSNIMVNQMRRVVNDQNGTGKLAKINNIDLGGKTGTSSRNEVNDFGKTIEHTDGWFIGFFKNNNKYYSMVVFVKDINSNESAATTAVPIFKDVVLSLTT